MLHRFTFWLRLAWQKLPMQVSLLGWPPLLSHSLAFIVGTLVLQRGEAGLRLPPGKILLPVDKLGRLETDGKSWRETQTIIPLARQGEGWCRSSDMDLKLWRAPGRSGDLYLQWPGTAATAASLQGLLQKKIVLTSAGSSFAYCSAATAPAAAAPGIHYD